MELQCTPSPVLPLPSAQAPRALLAPACGTAPGEVPLSEWFVTAWSLLTDPALGVVSLLPGSVTPRDQLGQMPNGNL